MTRTNITLIYDDDKFLNSVLLNVIEQLKAGEQKGKFARLGISVEYEQEISIDISTLDVRCENGCLIIKSKVWKLY